MAQQLLESERIERVLLADLWAAEMAVEVATRGRVAAIVLAAGESRRFGRPKQLLPWGKKTMLQHVVDVVLASPVERVIVVLAEGRAAEMAPTLAERPVEVVVNPEWREGLSASLRAGLAALGPETDAALFVLADQPGVTPEVVARIVERYREGRAPIVVPVHRRRRGNPALFDRSLFGELAAVRGDQGGREIIARYGDDVAEVAVASEAVLLDIDSPEDYEIRGPCDNEQ